MKAIILEGNDVKLQDVPQPENPATGNLIIKMTACGINAGDLAFIGGAFPPGSIPVSQYHICGVSGVGTVLKIGEGVPEAYQGKNVTVYRSLKFDDHITGTWSEYAELPYLHCAIVPENLNLEDYSGSLVNIITPYAFLKQIVEEGHKGIIATAGNSATGISMLGICQAYNFPLILIARTEKDKIDLEQLGATNIVVQNDDDFKARLKELSQKLSATAIYDGVGGEIINKIIDILPLNSTIYAYGYLGGKTPLNFHSSILMKGITLKAFGNFRTKTVQDSNQLKDALAAISEIMHMPHFKTKIGRKFTLEEIKEALSYTSESGAKAMLYF